MKNIYKILTVLVVVVTLGACSKEFINKDKPYSMTENIIFADSTYIESTLLGCYDVFKSSNPTFMGGLAYIVFDCRGEDIVNVSNPVTMQDTYEMKVLPTATENGRIWNYAYGTINTCNIFIQNMEDYNCKELLSEATYNQYVAEAKFIRAYCYYVLVNLYSQPYKLDQNAKAVPLRITALRSSGNNDCPAATIKDVYTQILADCVPADLANAPQTRDGVTRASAGAAHLLRMRIYMAMEDWDNAITEGTAISGYSLDPDVTKLYGQDTYNSPEMIFALPMSTQDNPNTQMSCAEYHSMAAAVAWLDTEGGILSQADYSLSGDARINKLITTDGTYYYSTKFVDKAQKLDWVPAMRYAEVLLNLAECYANKEGKLSDARNALKQVRSRSIPTGDTVDVDNIAASEIKSRVYNERRLEFICEGIRGVDIIRRGESFVKNNSLFKVTVAPTDNNYIWPVPDSEKNYNKTLGK